MSDKPDRYAQFDDAELRVMAARRGCSQSDALKSTRQELALWIEYKAANNPHTPHFFSHDMMVMLADIDARTAPRPKALAELCAAVAEVTKRLDTPKTGGK